MTNIQDLSAQLRLSYVRDNAETLIGEARQTQPDYADFLQNLLLREVERRTGNGITRRIKDARFPVKKYLVDFDKTKYGKGSIIITTNLTFEHWENLFKDPALTGAFIDRLRTRRMSSISLVNKAPASRKPSPG